MPFQPGQSGNPKGTAKSKPWAAAITRALARAEASGKGNDLNALAERVIAAGIAGDMAAVKEIGDRLDGKVPQGIIGGSPDDEPVHTISEIRNVIVDPRSPGTEGL